LKIRGGTKPIVHIHLIGQYEFLIWRPAPEYEILATHCSPMISLFSPEDTASCSLGLDQLCWHNFENNRHLKELGIMLE